MPSSSNIRCKMVVGIEFNIIEPSTNERFGIFFHTPHNNVYNVMDNMKIKDPIYCLEQSRNYHENDESFRFYNFDGINKLIAEVNQRHPDNLKNQRIYNLYCHLKRIGGLENTEGLFEAEKFEDLSDIEKYRFNGSFARKYIMKKRNADDMYFPVFSYTRKQWGYFAVRQLTVREYTDMNAEYINTYINAPALPLPSQVRTRPLPPGFGEIRNSNTKSKYIAKNISREIWNLTKSSNLPAIECSICLHETTEENLCITNCGHKYCDSCLDKISKCALCRKSLC